MNEIPQTWRISMIFEISNKAPVPQTLIFMLIVHFFRFFSYAEDTREERRLAQAALREHGRQEAMKRGKKLDENGKWNKVV